MAEQIVEMVLAREMPTDGGSEDPSDFNTNGELNGIPPALYPGMQYIVADGMEVDGGEVTIRMKIEPKPILPVLIYTRIGSPAEFWSVTPDDLYYYILDDSIWADDVEFDFNGDLGQYHCTLSSFYSTSQIAIGPKTIGLFTIPDGSLGFDFGSSGYASTELVSQSFSTLLNISSVSLNFDYFVFEDPWELGNNSKLSIYWESGVYGEEGWGYGSEEFDLDSCTAGENYFYLDEIPAGANIILTLQLTGANDRYLAASLASIKFTS